MSDESLAQARASLEDGERKLEAGDVQGALSCARRGLETLGHSYRSPGLKDDTGMKIHAAEALLDEGHAEEGARLLLRMLANRITLYEQKQTSSSGEG